MVPRPQHLSNRPLGFASCALAGMFWGCGFFFAKIALREMNVGAMVLYRFVFAVLCLLPLMLRHRPHFTSGEWRLLAFASLLGVPAQFLLQFYGLSLTTVSHASLMVGTLPVMLAIGATIFSRERLHGWGWVAIAVSTTGAAMIVFGHANRVLGQGAAPVGPSLRGDLLIVVSLFIALFWILLNQRLMATHSAILVTCYGTLLGTLMLAVVVPLFYGMPPLRGVSAHAWLALAASGLLCQGTATLLWNWGLTQVPASQAGVLLNMEPLVGSILGVVLLHESLGALGYIGGALIVGAAIALTTHSSREVQEAESAA